MLNNFFHTNKYIQTVQHRHFSFSPLKNILMRLDYYARVRRIFDYKNGSFLIPYNHSEGLPTQARIEIFIRYLVGIFDGCGKISYVKKKSDVKTTIILTLKRTEDNLGLLKLFKTFLGGGEILSTHDLKLILNRRDEIFKFFLILTTFPAITCIMRRNLSRVRDEILGFQVSGLVGYEKVATSVIKIAPQLWLSIFDYHNAGRYYYFWFAGFLESVAIFKKHLIIIPIRSHDSEWINWDYQFIMRQVIRYPEKLPWISSKDIAITLFVSDPHIFSFLADFFSTTCLLGEKENDLKEFLASNPRLSQKIEELKKEDFDQIKKNYNDMINKK